MTKKQDKSNQLLKIIRKEFLLILAKLKLIVLLIVTMLSVQTVNEELLFYSMNNFNKEDKPITFKKHCSLAQSNNLIMDKIAGTSTR